MDRFNGSYQVQSERAHIKISQLERKWKDILEEERRSCIRNKKLLEDFDQIKQQSKVFSKKNDRLKQAKHNFELYVKSVYPRWTEELKKLQELKKQRASKDSKPPSTDIKDDRKEKNRSEISGYVSDNVLSNPTFSSTPYRNDVSFTEHERLTHSVVLDEGNPMPKYSGYDQQYPSNPYQQYPFDSNHQHPFNSNKQYPNSNQQYPNSNQQYPSNSNHQHPFNGGYPRGHPMSNLSNNRSWVHPEALPSGRFPYSGNFSLDRARHAVPNMNHSTYGGQGRYGFNPDGARYFEMSNVPPGLSQHFQDNENSAEARAFQHLRQRDHDSYMDGINQVPPRHDQKHDDADPTQHINDSKSTYRKAENSDENDEQPKTRNVSENYADRGNHKTLQGQIVEERVESDGDINCSTDLKDNVGAHFGDESTHEKRRVVGEIGNTRDPELKVIKEANTEVSDVSTSFDNVRKNDENSGSSSIQVNPASNQEPIDLNQGRKEENDKENRVNSHPSLPSNQGHHEHSIEEQISKDSSNEVPESDVDSTPSNTPKGQGPQNMPQDSSPQPTDSAQVNQITNPDKSPEREVAREEEAKTSIMDDLVGDDEISNFEISGSEISEDVASEHEFVTGYDKENIQISENITEHCGTIPEMKDLKVQDNEFIGILPLNDDSALNEYPTDSKEVSIDIDDAETEANTGIEMYLQDNWEQSSEPNKIEEINETQERDFQIDSNEESEDSQGKEDLSHNLDHLAKKQDEEQRSDEEKSGVLEDLSFTSEDSESVSLKKKSDRAKSEKKNETRESVSYSENFEGEKSILLTETDAYQKMLSSVKVSDEEEDIEEDLLAGSTVSETNIVGQTKQDYNTQQLPKQHPVSESSISKKPAKVSKSKPKLSVFSSGEVDGLENSFGKDSEGILTSSWKSSEMSLSPPLSPDMDLGGYVPTVVGEKKVDGKETDKRMKGADEKEQRKVKQETGKEKQESKTKSRIQAGFWNNSDTESEVDLHEVSPGVDNDDDFDFYS